MAAGKKSSIRIQLLQVIKRLAHLDCILCLAVCKKSLGDGPVCRPNFIQDSKESVFDVVGLRHPCVVSQSGKSFIPNDTLIGGESRKNIILLTGPNMGVYIFFNIAQGKSTLLRQTCLAVIMAQIGSFVPAESLNMTTFDRIFTRIGTGLQFW